MAIPVSVTLTVAAAVSNGIAVSQAVSGAGALTLNGSLVSGGVAILDVARRVSARSGSAGDTTQTFRIVGTDRYGNGISESLALNGTTLVYTVQDFKTVTSITASAALAGNGVAGTNGVASTPWIFDNPHDTPFQLSIFCRKISGTPNYTAEYTPDDPNAPAGGYTAYPVFDTTEFQSNVPALAWPDATINALTQTLAMTVMNGPVFAHRLTIDAGSGAASVMMQSIQAGIHQ